MCNCNNQKITGTKACEMHQREWNKYIQTHDQQSFYGARRMLQRQKENLAWQAATESNTQPHDDVIVTTISHLYFVLFITFVTFAVATLLFNIVYSYTYTI